MVPANIVDLLIRLEVLARVVEPQRALGALARNFAIHLLDPKEPPAILQVHCLQAKSGSDIYFQPQVSVVAGNLADHFPASRLEDQPLAGSVDQP